VADHQTDRRFTDGVAFLRELTSEDIPPADAILRLDRLRKELGDESADLVWHVETIDGSIAYCLLLRDEDGCVVSLGRARGGLPWALRGVRAWSEEDLVRINGRVVKVEEAIAFLELDAPNLNVAGRIVDSLLLREEVRRLEEHVEAPAIQAQVDDLRRQLGLESSTRTLRWLTERGMAVADLESYARDLVLIHSLQRTAVDLDSIRAYFEVNRSAFAKAEIHWTWRPNEDRARSALDELLRGTPIEQLALDLSNDLERVQLPVAVRRFRRDLPDTFAPLFDPGVTPVFGPIPFRRGWVVGKRIDLTPAEWSQEVENAIREELFSQWLTARRSAARIEWLWGRADQSRHVRS
jgi:putative peptide maturation system protein